MRRSITIFDTSAVNKLLNDPDVEILCAGIRAAYFVRVPGTVVGELVAARSRHRRERLLAFSRRLIEEGEVILPFAKIITECTRSFKLSAADFDWRRIPIRFEWAEHQIALNSFPDEIAAAQKRQANSLESEFLIPFRQMQANFEKLFREGAGKPLNGSSIDMLVRPPLGDMLVGCMREGGSMWLWGKWLFSKGDLADADEKTVHQFCDACPPFRALLVVLCILQYEYGIRDTRRGTSFRAGRADSLMASYLPYCDKFISDDERQINLLKEVVAHANLPGSSVLSYSEFRHSLIGLNL